MLKMARITPGSQEQIFLTAKIMTFYSHKQIQTQVFGKT